jgi:hypothetical protein
MANKRWFRFYEDTMNNPKAQRLPGDLFKFWVNCLCVASSRDGSLPCVADLAFALRLPEKKTADWLADLESRQLLDPSPDDGRYTMHDWSEYQYASDSSAGRVKRYRERRKGVTGNDDVTLHPPLPQRHSNGADTDTDTDTEKKDAPAPIGAPSVLTFKSPEARFFDRGKEVLGRASGGLLTRLLRHHGDNVPLAVASVEVASTKSDPREYIGAIIANHGRDGETRPDGLRPGRDVF